MASTGQIIAGSVAGVAIVGVGFYGAYVLSQQQAEQRAEQQTQQQQFQLQMAQFQESIAAKSQPVPAPQTQAAPANDIIDGLAKLAKSFLGGF